MRSLKPALAISVLIGLGTAAWSETTSATSGSDTFMAGPVVSETINASGDTFIAARSADTKGVVSGDLHVTGYDIVVRSDTSEDLYAFGATVTIAGSVAQDVTAGGFTVRTEPEAEINGNARLFGNSVTIEGPINGALTVTARDVVLNAALGDDVRIMAQTISFGPNATIAGTLTYSTKNAIAVPDRVAEGAQVVFRPISSDAFGESWDEWGDWSGEMLGFPTFASVFAGFVISLLFFVALGAVLLGFAPQRVERLRTLVNNSPGQTFLLGLIGLSMLFGAVPVTVLTVIGLPFVPIAILAIVVAWTLGYALGAYSIAMRVWTALGGEEEPNAVSRLLVYATAITVIALLNFIPFVGWVANYTLVLLGIGAMTHAVFQYVLGNQGPELDVDMAPIEK